MSKTPTRFISYSYGLLSLRTVLALTISLLFIWTSAFADSIYMVTNNSTNAPTPLCLGADCFSQVLMMSWTSLTSFNNVSISAEVGGDNPSADVTAYLTTRVGVGATVSNQIASATLTTPMVDSPALLLFSGLTLAPGTYYLVLSGSAIAAPISYWYEYNLATASGAAGVSSGTVGFANVVDPSSTPNGTYAPSSVFDTTGNLSLSVQVTGTAASVIAPEPSSFRECAIIAGLAIVFVIIRRRRTLRSATCPVE